MRAGNAVVAYLRTGNGQPVLLLRRAGTDDALWAALLETTATRFRVILPESMPEVASFTEWFAAFHDGLGLGPVRVVADATYGLPVLRLTLLQGERIERVVMLTNWTGDEVDGVLNESTLAEAGEQDAPARRAHPVRFVSVGGDPRAVAAHVVECLVSDSSSTR